MTPNARQTFSASCAINSRASSMPAADAWPPWGRSKLRLTRRNLASLSDEPARLLGGYGARLGQQLLQFTALVHLQGDVAAADQLAVDVELRKGGPLRVGLQRLAHFRVFENIDVRELRLAGPQSTDCLRGKAALREVGCALHVKHDGGGRQLALDSFNCVHNQHSPRYSFKTVRARARSPNVRSSARCSGWLILCQQAISSIVR